MRELIGNAVSACDTDSEKYRTAIENIVALIQCDEAKLYEFKDYFVSNNSDRRVDLVVLGSVFESLDFIPTPTCSAKLPQYVYRGCNQNPQQIIDQKGFLAKTGTRSVLKHKETTGTSIYISTSKNLTIALEHAYQGENRWVYKIDPLGGICTADFLKPLPFLDMEEEVIFPLTIPLAQIIGVAWEKDWENLGTDFFPLDNPLPLVTQLVELGVVKL